MSKKISSIVDEKTWQELQSHAKETSRNLSGLLTEAIQEYLQRRRVRPEFRSAMKQSIKEHEDLGRLLAK